MTRAAGRACARPARSAAAITATSSPGAGAWNRPEPAAGSGGRPPPGAATSAARPNTPTEIRGDAQAITDDMELKQKPGTSPATLAGRASSDRHEETGGRRYGSG